MKWLDNEPLVAAAAAMFLMNVLIKNSFNAIIICYPFYC
jgi:hypothetical protein